MVIIGGGAMNDKRVRSFVLVITFLCSLVAGSHEANRKFAQGFVTTGVDRNIHDIDEDTAEKMWLHCRKELLEITEDYEYSDLYIPPAASDGQNVAEPDISLLKKRILHKAITDLPPHAKHNLLNCLDKELSQTQSYEKNSEVIDWYKLFFDWSSVPRRYLQRRHAPNHHKHKARQGKPATAASRRAGVVHPPEPPSPAPATPDDGTTTLNVKTEKSQAPSPGADAPSPGADAPQGQNNGTSSGSKGSLFGASAIGQTQNKKTPLDALEQLRKKEDQSPAPETSPTKKSNAPSPSPTEKGNSPAPSPPKQNTPPAPSPPEKSKAPAPAPPEKSKESAPPPPEKSTEPPPSPPHISKPPETSPAKKHKSPESSADEAQPEDHEASSSKPKDKSETGSNKTGVIAGCSVAGAVIIAIFLCCCLRKKNKDDDLDDKPFSLYSNDLSAGTLQTSNGKGNSSDAGFNSSSNESTLPVVSSALGAEAQSSGAAGDENLPPPPGKPGPPPPAAPPPPPPKPAGPKAPPPPAAPKAPPPKPGRPPPLGPNNKRRGSKDVAEGSEDQKAKLKPFFWDKVLANPDHSMVWNEIKSGSFQFNEEMMESLFGYKAAEQNKNERKKDPSAFEAPKYIQIIDPRKAQNLSILLRALNVTTEEVCDAILEGNELPAELIQTLLKMAPTTEEELKLRLYDGELSQLGPAERFLKTMVDIPFAFKRLESLLFMCSVQEEVSSIKESLACIEVACNELKNSRVFLKLLEAVLKTGNRMNDGTFRGGAQAFKLDTLLKLSDVKGTDGKTTLLHFVVLEIIRSEGIRAARKARENQSPTSVKTDDAFEDSSKETADYVRKLGLEVVSNLSNDLENVKKAAVVDGDMLTSTVLRLGHSLKKSKEFLNNEMDGLDGESEFRETLSSFVQQAEEDIIWLLEEEKKMTSLVKSTADYFHGTQGKDEGLRLFSIVRDFLLIVDKVCNEVKKSTTNPIKIPKKMTSSASTASQESRQPTSPNLQQRLFPAIKEQRPNGSSSSDSGSSDDEK